MLNFKAVLTNVPFDKQYKNVLKFEDREAQETFFDVASLFLDATDINFNAGSLLETTIIYKVRENESINDLLSKNYCIIKDGNSNATLKYYYYFVKNAIQDSANQLKVWLELDIFQTYYIDLEFADCEILKANLNRFVDNGDGTVSFDGATTSELFEREDIKDVAKRLTKRTKLKFSPGEVGEWLDRNVCAWLYCFIDPFENPYNIVDLGDTVGATQTIEPLSNNATPTNFSCLAVPIYTADAGANRTVNLYGYTDYADLHDVFQVNVELSVDALNEFLQANNGFAHVYGVKVSCIPPKEISGSIQNDKYMSLESRPYYVPTKSISWDAPNQIAYVKGCLVCRSTWQDVEGLKLETQQYTVENDFTFNKVDIIGDIKRAKYNPKLLNSDYKEVRINAYSTEGFAYDLQKLNKKNFKVQVSEAISPETTRNYARISSQDLGGVYIQETNKNYTGNVTNVDMNVPQITSYYQNAMAFQKNFFQQNEANRMFNLTKSLFGNITNPLGMLFGGGQTVLGNLQNKINENFTVDNMKASPSLVQNGSNGVFLSTDIKAIGVFVEEYDILDNEKEIVNDYMCKFGFTYNKIGNIKNFDNIRKYYNYVQAELEETHGINISNAVHDLFVKCFANGVRFWNADVFDENNPFSYTLENYEKWLEE